MRRVLGLLAAGVIGTMAFPAAAEDSLLESLGRSSGLIAPEPDMPDFVKASRPKGAATPLPAFAPPPEPKSRVKSAAELKAMDADLERAAHGGRPPAPARKTKSPKS